MRYRKWVLEASLLLVIGMVVGIADPTGIGLPPEYIAKLKELSKMPTPSSAMTLLIILSKNVIALLTGFALSPVFCIAPLITLFSNGWLIGYISTGVVKEASIGYLLAGTLPHGIFEIPALVMAQASALSFGTNILTALFKRRKSQQIIANLKQNARYLAIALILLVPAAIIETYVTPWLLTWLFKING